MNVNENEKVSAASSAEEHSESTARPDAISSVVNVPEERLNKRPLRYAWTLRHLVLDLRKSWDDTQREIGSFNTLEDFWKLYNSMKPPTELAVGEDYSLFKKCISLMWDPSSIQGGRWQITLNDASKKYLNTLWRAVLLFLISETFEDSNQIRGAVVSRYRETYKISIWTSDSNNRTTVLKIGYKMHLVLPLEDCSMEYLLHNFDAKPMYTI